jgi:hypothetical protein
MSTVDISAWGATPPAWIQLLANAVEGSSRAEVARRLGVSRTSVSLLLINNYPNPSTAKMQAKVEGMLAAVSCPILGEISGQECQKEREKPFSSGNQARIPLYRACRSCPNNPNRQENGHE